MKLRKIMAGVVAGVVAASSIAVAASALDYTIDGGIYGVTNASFTISDGGSAMLAADEGTGFYYVMDIPGGGPEDAADAASCDAVLEQNRNLWANVDKVTVKFKLNTSADPEIDDFSGFYVMTFLQLGNASGWSWNDSGSTPDLTKIEEAMDEANPFEFGKEYTAVFYPKAAIEAKGTEDPSSGVLKMGITVGNNGIDELGFDIEFTDLVIEGDQAVIDKYTALAKGGDAAAEEAPADEAPADEAEATDAEKEVVEEAAPADEVADTTATTTTATKDSPDTGVEGIAVVAGLAVLATGAVIISKKRK